MRLLTDVHIATCMCMQTLSPASFPGCMGGGNCNMGTRPTYIHMRKCLQVLASCSPLVWESQLEILQHGQAGYWRFLHKRLHIVHRPCAVHILWTLLDSLKVISYLELFLKLHALLLWSIISKHSVVHAHTCDGYLVVREAHSTFFFCGKEQ